MLYDIEPAITAARDPVAEQSPELQSVISAAVLVVAAFRMRDEPGLITALRLLTQAVEQFQRLMEDMQ